jgi:hypothetical protein
MAGSRAFAQALPLHSGTQFFLAPEPSWELNPIKKWRKFIIDDVVSEGKLLVEQHF